MANNWFKGASLYQIYPRSFADANGDGMGDLQGIIAKLDYLGGNANSLGVDAIWLSPVFPSPMADFGYDVSDYCDIDPLFGTLDDFRQLLGEAHRRKIKVMMDFVPNHSSDQHAWFTESRASRDNPKRDWYIWKDPKADGSPPTNWESVFGGSAWTLDEITGQYYMHSFLREQPDLNWENLEVRAAMQDVMRFWFNMGVDGLRVDAVKMLPKDSDFRDHKKAEVSDLDDPGEVFSEDFGSKDADEKLELYFKEMTKVAHEYDDRCLLFEHYPDNMDKPAAYAKLHKLSDAEVSAPFNFSLMFKDWKAKEFKDYIDGFQKLLSPEHAPVYVLGNHDQARLATRFGERTTRTAAVLLMTLPGMIVTYYGEELGMLNGKIPVAKVQDPLEKNIPGKGLGRDPERTPMQWSASRHGGFSPVEPWLPMNPDYQTRNVEKQLASKTSILNLYRELFRLRNQLVALSEGAYEPFEVNHKDVLGFLRVSQGQELLTLLNFSARAVTVKTNLELGKLLLTSHLDAVVNEVDLGVIKLRPHEAWIIDLQA